MRLLGRLGLPLTIHTYSPPINYDFPRHLTPHFRAPTLQKRFQGSDVIVDVCPSFHFEFKNA